jgi:uracil-DNA glycosylase family 4
MGARELSYSPEAAGARCDLCPLRGRPVVRPTPALLGPKLIVIGEHPSKHDEAKLQPLTPGSKSGQLLDATLRENGIKNRSEIHVTTAALCRGEKDKDNEAASLCCAPRLLREVHLLRDGARNPTILALGKAATFSILGTKKLLYARGFVWHAAELDPAAVRAAKTKAAKTKKTSDILTAAHLEGRAPLAGRVVFPTTAPGFILKAETWMPIWRIDLRRAIRWAWNGPSSLEDQGALRVGGLEVLEGLGKTVSLDIETDGVKWLECKMLCCGFADSSGQAAVIYPWKPRFAPGLSRWLRTREAVVGHNTMAFDAIVLKQHGVK